MVDRIRNNHQVEPLQQEAAAIRVTRGIAQTNVGSDQYPVTILQVQQHLSREVSTSEKDSPIAIRERALRELTHALFLGYSATPNATDGSVSLAIEGVRSVVVSYFSQEIAALTQAAIQREIEQNK